MIPESQATHPLSPVSCLCKVLLTLQDFPAAIAASDRFDHFLLRSYLRSVLVIYGGLLTKFEKNWAKVINPKGSGSSGGMY